MLRSGQHTFCFLSDESRHSCSNKDAKLYNTKPFDCFTIRVFLHFFLGGGALAVPCAHKPIIRVRLLTVHRSVLLPLAYGRLSHFDRAY